MKIVGNQIVNDDGKPLPPPKRKGKAGANMMLGGMGLIAVFITFVSPLALVFLLVGLLPSVSAFFVDRRKGRLTTKTVFCFNMCGIMPYIVSILNFSGSTDASDIAKNLIADVYIWCFVYLSASAGWFTAWIVPKITVMVVEHKRSIRTAMFEKTMKDLTEEWGPEVRKG